MASIEMLGGNEAVAQRTRKHAENLGDLAMHNVHRDLDQFVGPEADDLSDTQVEAIAEKKKKEAIAKYTNERNEGLHNDKASIGVGLTALVRGVARRRIEKWSDAQMTTMFSPVLTEVGEAETETLYRLDLPQGAFISVATGVYFYPEAKVPYPGYIVNLQDNPHDFHERIGLSHITEVVRIEGVAGELWQSPYLNPDGTHRGQPVVIDIE